MKFADQLSHGTKILAVVCAVGWFLFLIFLVCFYYVRADFTQRPFAKVERSKAIPTARSQALTRTSKISSRAQEQLKAEEILQALVPHEIPGLNATRVPASFSQDSLTIEPSNTNVLEEKMPKATAGLRATESVLSFEGFLWNVLSNEQLYSSGQSARATGLGLKWTQLYEKVGFDLHVKSGVTGLNSQGRESSLKQLEGRSHLRFFGLPYGMAPSLQSNISLGYEIYRNSGPLISGEYDLIKLGYGLEFPFYQKWKWSGEVAYGLGFDQSKKIQLATQVGYRLNRNWGFSTGYRFGLFEAGSLRSSPQSRLPFREGLTEGFTSLDYRF